MTLQRTTTPAEPLSLEDAKRQARLEVDADDDVVIRCLRAATEYVEGQSHRALRSATYTYTIDCEWPFKFGSQRIDFPINPIASVTSIKYVDDNGATQTLDVSQYTVAARDHGSYIVPSYGVTWPSIRPVPNAITIIFIGGSDTDVPATLSQAVAILTAHLYENRGDMAAALQDIPAAVETLVSPLRRSTLG